MINSISAQKFSYKKSGEGIEIKENNKPVLFFQTKSKTVSGKFARAGYIHPLYDLNGNAMTDDMPEDHPYHRGIFWAWHQIIVDGKNVADGWMSDHVSFNPGKMQVTKSATNTILTSQLTWKIDDSIKPAYNIVNEVSKINIYRAKEHYRIIDFDIFLKPLVNDLKLGGSDDPKGYGGFCLRLQNPESIQFISGDKQITPEQAAVFAGPWMDFRMKNRAVAVFGYKNAEGQHPWILRNEKSMQNVPFPGRGPVTIPAEGLRLKYRIVIHDDTFTADNVQKLYDEYLK